LQPVDYVNPLRSSQGCDDKTTTHVGVLRAVRSLASHLARLKNARTALFDGLLAEGGAAVALRCALTNGLRCPFRAPLIQVHCAVLPAHDSGRPPPASAGAQPRASAQQPGLPDPLGVRGRVCCFRSGCACVPAAHAKPRRGNPVTRSPTRTLISPGKRNGGRSGIPHSVGPITQTASRAKPFRTPSVFLPNTSACAGSSSKGLRMTP